MKNIIEGLITAILLGGCFMIMAAWTVGLI